MSERAKLLLVDDRPENLLALEALLEPLGQELVRADSGEEALRHLLQDEFAAILLDVQMPGLDGFQTAELIKQRERTRHVPIIFLTAISKDAEHVFRGYDAGAVDYLMKPFDPHILRAKVAVFIDLWQKTVEIRRQDALLKEQELGALERESEERYRSLADAVPQIVWTTRCRTASSTSYNERWYEYTGIAASRAAEVSALERVVHPDDRPGDGSSAGRRRGGRGEPFEVEYRLRRASDGSYRWHLGRAVCHDGATTARSSPAGSARPPTSRTASSPRSGRPSSPKPAGCSAARSTTSRRSPTSRGSRCRGSPTGAPSTSSSTAGSSAWRSSTSTRSRSRSRGSSRRRCWPRPRPPARRRSARAQPVLVREIDDEALATFGFDERQLEIARALAPRSYVTVPLVARGEVFGSISLVTAESGRDLRRGRPDARPGAGPARGGGDRQRPALRRGRADGDAPHGRSKPSATASSSSTATA